MRYAEKEKKKSYKNLSEIDDVFVAFLGWRRNFKTFISKRKKLYKVKVERKGAFIQQTGFYVPMFDCGLQW